MNVACVLVLLFFSVANALRGKAVPNQYNKTMEQTFRELLAEVGSPEKEIETVPLIERLERNSMFLSGEELKSIRECSDGKSGRKCSECEKRAKALECKAVKESRKGKQTLSRAESLSKNAKNMCRRLLGISCEHCVKCVLNTDNSCAPRHSAEICWTMAMEIQRAFQDGIKPLGACCDLIDRCCS